MYDFQAPRKEEKNKSGVTLHNDRTLHFKERSTPSMSSAGDELTLGLGIKREGGAAGGSVAPISFKKRKLNLDHRKNIRRRNDDD